MKLYSDAENEYFVDLRSLSPDDYSKTMNILGFYATMHFDVSGCPHVYQVIWDRADSISDLLHINPALVGKHFPLG